MVLPRLILVTGKGGTGKSATAGALALAPKLADAQSVGCEHPIQLDDSVMACYRYGPELPPPPRFSSRR